MIEYNYLKGLKTDTKELKKAIKHCRMVLRGLLAPDDILCRREHEQLLFWLEELLIIREKLLEEKTNGRKRSKKSKKWVYKSW